jgi:TRAP-type C4-dicarboxylate transport system permease small subunit
MIRAVLDRLDHWSNRVAESLFRVATLGGLPALVALVTLDVVLRYVFDAPLRWGRNVNGLLLLITMFGALPHAWDRGYHIRMELVYERLRGRTRGWADVIAACSGVIVLGLLLVQAWVFVPYMARTGETGEELLVPFWPFMGFVGFCALVFVARLISNPQALPLVEHEGDELWR